MSADRYESPLSTRYASRDMQKIFSDDYKFTTWRRLWVALAEAEQQLGLPISDQQIAELKAHVRDINYADAAAKEKEIRHDVMAHIYAYGLQCPTARPILHLGATSCYVQDNTAVIQMRDGLRLIRGRLLSVISQLAAFADRWKDQPCLAYTHFQPAQPTTVGKRACLWIQDLIMALDEVDHALASLRLLGSKGTTGTQASFLELFAGDAEKVDQLDALIAEKMGFAACFPVSGQTYPRGLDLIVVHALEQLAAAAAKFATDLRLLQHEKELEEPFEAGQVGSSAMPYKRNPMRCERIVALSRWLISLAANPAYTAADQWLERTLDDSANRRLALAESFLTADGILNLLLNVTAGLVVHPKMIERHLNDELPFLASENILMDAVKAGGDRQALHEKLRRYSQQAAARVKDEGKDNDLLERIAADDDFHLDRRRLDELLDPRRYTGCARRQCEHYLQTTVRPLLQENREVLGATAELAV